MDSVGEGEGGKIWDIYICKNVKPMPPFLSQFFGKIFNKKYAIYVNM